MQTHFCPKLIFWCHFRQTLVGANIRPERHWLPKAACPARWVPPPDTRGIRATARPSTFDHEPHVCDEAVVGLFNIPVPQDSAEVWWPAFSLTAYGCLLFLAIPECTVLLPSQPCSSVPGSLRSIILNNIRTNWRSEYCRERVSRSTRSTIRRGNGDSRARRHLDIVLILLILLIDLDV